MVSLMCGRCLTVVTKIFLRLTQIVAGVQQGIGTVAITAPRFDLVEVAVISTERVVGRSSGQSLMTG